MQEKVNYRPSAGTEATADDGAAAVLDVLRKAIAILEQLQENPAQARDIINQGYFGHALVLGRRMLAESASLVDVPQCNGSHDYSAISAGLEAECSVCTGAG